MKFNIPLHIRRLILVFIVFIAIFLGIRNWLIPESFGEKGHYRANSLIENASIEIHYAGQNACFDCHQDIEDAKVLDLHETVRCEVCHGPGQNHVNSGEASDISKPNSREFCGSCHVKNPARSLDVIRQIDLEEHNVGQNCTECHNPHQPWEMLN